MSLREKVKRHLPKPALAALQSLREQLGRAPLEDIVLHGYRVIAEANTRRRLTLVIPSIAPEKTFGGIVTGIDIFLEIGKRSDADLRIILDEIGPIPSGHIVGKRAQHLGIDPQSIEIVPRAVDEPIISVRPKEVFLNYNWWTALNTQELVKQQSKLFCQPFSPTLYLIQEYEPFFHEFSSTHMMARQAFNPATPCWGIFNSGELFSYFSAQGHKLARSYVFEPQLNDTLRNIMNQARPKKEKRLLVYGRPGVMRNCYPAVDKGVRTWAAQYPEFSEWAILSAGLAHKPVDLGGGRRMDSAGKLGMEQYGELLLSSGVGLSLMSSPHPSYPPLEMAHFGLLTVTNSYTNKDLTRSHENITSIDNISPGTIAEALGQACRSFEADPDVGWRGKSLRPSFLEARPFEFLEQLVADLQKHAW